MAAGNARQRCCAAGDEAYACFLQRPSISAAIRVDLYCIQLVRIRLNSSHKLVETPSSITK
jgi:hypothetical protein